MNGGPVIHTEQKPGRMSFSNGVRIINIGQPRGVATLIRVGLPTDWRGDLYHRALTLSWPQFMGLIAFVYLMANLFFAFLYWLQPASITNAAPGSYLDAFFFSVETIGTIGYGVLSPATVYANSIMTVEVLCGIVLVALTTGVTFARVSRPTARVLFSHVAVVAPHNGVRTLMVRMGNQRVSQILQAEVTMTLVKTERTLEGSYMRRFYDLALERSRTPVFAMSFQAMHRIDESSLLFGATHETLVAMEAEILVTVTGLEETMAQTVHARASFIPDEILFDHRYVDIFGVMDDGRRAVDYRRFHDVEKI